MVNLLKAWFETFGFDSILSMNGKAVGTRNVRLAFLFDVLQDGFMVMCGM